MIVRSFIAESLREWRLAISNSVMPLAMIVIGVLTLLALLASGLRTTQRVETQNTLIKENLLHRQWLESVFDESESTEMMASELEPAQSDRKFELQMSAKSPDLMRYTEGIWWTIYPATTISNLSMGASRAWPDHYHHGGSSSIKTLKRSVRFSPLLATIGVFDLTLLVGAILPLAVIVLTYNNVAADREQGRWSLVGLHASSIPRLIVMRCLIKVIAIAAIVVALTTICLMSVYSNEWEFMAVRNFALWIVWLAAYLSVWTVITIFVNSLPMSSSGAGLLLILCWCILVIAVPSVVQRGVDHNYEIPPREVLIDIEEEIQKQAEHESEEILTTFLRQHPEIQLDDENPQQKYLLLDVAVNRTIRSRVHVRLQEYYQQFLERESALDQLQLMSPLLAFRTAADQFAGTSLRHYVDFAKQTARFHEKYIQYFEPYSISGKELSQSDIHGIPRFDSDKLETRLHYFPLLMSSASLLLWTAFFGGISWWNFKRRTHI